MRLFPPPLLIFYLIALQGLKRTTSSMKRPASLSKFLTWVVLMELIVVELSTTMVQTSPILRIWKFSVSWTKLEQAGFGDYLLNIMGDKLLLNFGAKFLRLYYYMRNFCNLIGLERWYFSLIWNTYTWKLQTF